MENLRNIPIVRKTSYEELLCIRLSGNNIRFTLYSHEAIVYNRLYITQCTNNLYYKHAFYVNE